MTCPFNPLTFPVVLRTPHWLSPGTPADGRLPLAMLVVAMLEPARVVELGVGRGHTYAALCQAVQELRLASQCLGVELDTPVTAMSVKPDTADDFRSRHAALYGSFSRLTSGDVQGAATQFSDGTVDLLLLGPSLNNGEAAAAFRQWLPKLSARATVLVSNINAAENGQGGANFWTDTKDEYPHFELQQGQGLGLLLVGAEQPESLARLTHLPTQEGVALRELLYQLGVAAASSARQAGGPLQAQNRSLEDLLAENDRAWRASESEISSLNQTVLEQTEHLDKLQGRLEFVMAREREIRALYLDLHQQLLNRDQDAVQGAERDRAIAARDEAIAWLQAEWALAQAELVTVKDEISAARRDLRAEADRFIAERDEAIAWLQAEWALAQAEVVLLKDQVSAARESGRAEADRIVAARDEGITWLRAELALAQAEIRTIHASRSWRAVMAVWEVRGRFATLFRGLASRAQ